MINTVKLQGTRYLVNGTRLVPLDIANKDYQEVQAWLLTNVAEPEYTDVELLTNAQKAKVLELNSLCSTEIESGFTSIALDTATPTTYYYQSEEIDQLNLIGLVVSGADDSIKCSLDGISFDYALHTNAELTQVLNDGKAFKIVLLIKVNDLKILVNSALTVADVDLVVW